MTAARAESWTLLDHVMDHPQRDVKGQGISLQDLIVSLRKIGALRVLRVNAKQLQSLFRSECEAEGIAISADDDGNRVRLGRFQVMGVLASLADEKKCGGTSRLEKIENLTKMFLFPSEGASEGMADVKAFEEQSEEEEVEGCNAAVEQAAQDDNAATPTAIPSFARPLQRSLPLPSAVRRSILDAPELPYLAPKIIRSPAKNYHVSERQNKNTRWNMLSRSLYDADALLQNMMKSAEKVDDAHARRTGRPSSSRSTTISHSTVASALQHTTSFISSANNSAPSSPLSPSQSAKIVSLPSSARGKRVLEQRLQLARKDSMNRSAHSLSPPAAEAKDVAANEKQCLDEMVSAAAAVKAAGGTAHVLHAIFNLCVLISRSKNQWSMDVSNSVAAVSRDEDLWICVSDALLSGHPMAHVAARLLMFVCRSEQCHAALLQCGAMHIISSALSEPKASAPTIIMCLTSLQLLLDEKSASRFRDASFVSAVRYAESADIEVPLVQLLLEPPEHLLSFDGDNDEPTARSTPRHMILSCLLALLSAKRCRMQLLKGPLLKWCSGYLEQRIAPPRASPKADDNLLDYVKTFAKTSRPKEDCIVRALQRQLQFWNSVYFI